MQTTVHISDANFNSTSQRTRSVLHYIHHSVSAVSEALLPIYSHAKHINIANDKMQEFVL